MRPQVYFSAGAECHLQTQHGVVLIDPHLDGADLPVQYADCLLLTGSDLCQRSAEWLRLLLARYPRAQVVAPSPVYAAITAFDSARPNVHLATPDWLACGPSVQVLALACGSDQAAGQTVVGYVLALPEGRLYLAGATEPSAALLDQLKAVGPLQTVVLPVVAGNRLAGGSADIGLGFSVYEAMTLAQELQVGQLVVQPHGAVSPEEVRLVHQRMGCQANLLVHPQQLQLGKPKASVVVRTLNEARYLEELLQGIAQQQTDGLDCEVVLVDSGSTDQTVPIAEKYGCRILHITREQFSFGRSLNMGCEAASGDVLVITSGHCVPASPHWLQQLCQPLLDGVAEYSYGKQLGGPTSQFSECRVFEKYFPDTSRIPQQGFYCNNANSALLKSAWARYRFDEDLTGLEDMELAQRLVRDGGRVAYVAEAPVYHHHSETWPQVLRRFEREAIALQQIMPNIHVGWLDAVRYTLSSIWGDLRRAKENQAVAQNFANIVRYRYYQYSGSYRGNHEHRKLSHAEKDRYFYPH